jgi:glutathione S-transferase
MPNLTLVYAPRTCALVPYILLTEAGAEFEVRPINMMRGAHMTPEFLRLTPKHKVPVLLQDGVPLTETIAMQLWIARTYPKARLLPADFAQEIKAVSLLAWCASNIHPTLTPNMVPQRYCDLPGSEESVRRCAQKLMHENFQIADQMLAGREWFFDHFTCPDVHFFWAFRRATLFGIDVSGHPNCMAHLERMKQRPSVQKLLAYEARIIAEFEPAKAAQ